MYPEYFSHQNSSLCTKSLRYELKQSMYPTECGWPIVVPIFIRRLCAAASQCFDRRGLDAGDEYEPRRTQILPVSLLSIESNLYTEASKSAKAIRRWQAGLSSLSFGHVIEPPVNRVIPPPLQALRVVYACHALLPVFRAEYDWGRLILRG